MAAKRVEGLICSTEGASRVSRRPKAKPTEAKGSDLFHHTNQFSTTQRLQSWLEHGEK